MCAQLCRSIILFVHIQIRQSEIFKIMFVYPYLNIQMKNWNFCKEGPPIMHVDADIIYEVGYRWLNL